MYSKLSIIMSVTLVTAAILTVQSSSMLQVSYAQLSADDPNIIENMHNQERANVQVPTLTWSDSLARDAQSWANYIASLNLRPYNGPNDPGDLAPHASWEQRKGQGENLAWGARGTFPVSTFVQGWANEKSNCLPGCMIPADGSLGTPPRVYGHYTQMVWSTVTQIGCGKASDANQDYLVCRYDQAGNYPNQAPYGQGAGAAGAVGEEQNTLGDQGVFQ
jgi:Cysteine-rich secretory protein family